MIERYTSKALERGPVNTITSTYIPRGRGHRKSNIWPLLLLALPSAALVANCDNIRKYTATKLEASINNYTIKSVGNSDYFVINNTLYPVVVRRLGNGANGECHTIEQCLSELLKRRPGQDLVDIAANYTKRKTGISVGKLQPGDKIYLPGDPFGGQ